MIRLGDRVRYQGCEWDVWSDAPLRKGDPQTPVQPELDLFSGDAS